jgi:hypothetical protein
MKNKLTLFFVCTLLVFILPVICANSLYASSNSLSFTTGQTVSVQVNINASESDVYGVQFDIDFDSNVLSFNSISEGGFLGSDGAKTIFNYSSVSSGKVNNIYNLRNKTNLDSNPGIKGTGTITVLNFIATNSGVSVINLSDVTWVNSTIGNDSAQQATLTIEGISISVSGSSTSSNSGSPSSGGGGGGGSTYRPPINNTNKTIHGTNNQGSVNFEIQNSTQNKTLEENNKNNSLGSGGNSPLTGRIVDSLIGEGGVFRSWVFYFVLGLVILFVVIIVVRKKYLKKSIVSVSNY